MTGKNPTERTFRRIVAKFGTSLLTGGGASLDPKAMANLVSQVATLRNDDRDVLVVSSGAMAAGRDKLGLSPKVRGIPQRQVLASAGQGRLMHAYEELFDEHGIVVAQALLTRTDLADRAGYLNARNTLLALIELGVVCIVNENDVVAIDEIQQGRFGDNDNLSAMVANLIDADLLLLLGDVDGLHTADPRLHPDAPLVRHVATIDGEIEKLAANTVSSAGIGGMVTKIEAARLATYSGVTVVIADGRQPDILVRLASGEAVGTRFSPAASRLESRKRWMLSGLSTRGKLVIDSGAALALKKQKRSLLAAGIEQAQGTFERGDIVEIDDSDGARVGCGITNYGSRDVEVLKGSHSDRIADLLGHDYGSEIVHRNNLVVL